MAFINIIGDLDGLREWLVDQIDHEKKRQTASSLKRDQAAHKARAGAFQDALRYADAALRSGGTKSVPLRETDEIIEEVRNP